MKRYPRGAPRPTDTTLSLLPAPVCEHCGKGFVRSLWAVLRTPRGGEVLLHLAGCVEAWQAAQADAARGASAPKTSAR
jgi:hypothetical protein